MTVKNNNFNKEWIDMLSTLVTNDLKSLKTYKNLFPSITQIEGEQDGLSHKKLHGKKISDLSYKDTGSYFNMDYLKNLKKLLSGFSEKNQYEKRILQKELLELYGADSYWKDLSQRSMHDIEPLKEIFGDDYHKFHTLTTPFFFPTKKDLSRSQRAYLNYAPSKLLIFYKGMFQLLVTKGNLKNLEAVVNITEQDVAIIVKDYISINIIFYDITRIVLRKVYDNLYNPNVKKTDLDSEQEKFKETSLCVHRNTVFYESKRMLGLYFINCALQYFVEKRNLNIEMVSVLNVIRNFVSKKQYIYDTKAVTWWFLEHSQLVFSIMSIYEGCGVVKEVVKEQKFNSRTNSKEFIQWILPVKAEPAVARFTELPRIFVPDKISDEDLDEMLTPSLFGENVITKNDAIKNILTTKQKKRFRINSLYLSLLKQTLNIHPFSQLHNILVEEESTFKLPYPSSSEIYQLKSDVDHLKSYDYVSILEKEAQFNLHSKIVGSEIKNLNINDTKILCNISHFDLNLQDSIEKAKKELQKAKQKLKYVNSCIVIAERFLKIPLYITNTICVRLRMYPKQSLISRTSGDLKQLLCDYTDTVLTTSGLIELTRCYYQTMKDSSFKENFELFLKKINLKYKKTSKTSIYKYVKENPVNFQESEVFLYTSNLHLEILKSEKTKKSSVNVEIDQVASVLMFMALFFRNKKMARLANLTGETVTCPYSYIMNYMKENHKCSDGVVFCVKGFVLVTQDRIVTKVATMCFGYSQTSDGRYKDLLTRAYEVFPGEKDLVMEQYLLDYSTQFEDHFDIMFPNIVKQIQILKNICEIVVKECGIMSISNISQTTMKWRRFKQTSGKKKVFHPVTKKLMDISVSTSDVRKDGSVLHDMQAHKRVLLSYIIHSIDASVVQYFIVQMKEKHNVIINTLHDCVLLHPNDVQHFYDVAEELYKSGKLYNIADECFFQQQKREVSPFTVPKIEALEKEFYALCDDFEDELQNINIRNAYKGEN
jgi:hypothetical protein